MDSSHNYILFQTYNSILDHIKYRSGYNGKFTINPTANSFQYSNNKREYKGLIDNNSNDIHICIKEDSGTRIVFSGVVYTMEQFFLIDQLTIII